MIEFLELLIYLNKVCYNEYGDNSEKTNIINIIYITI